MNKKKDKVVFFDHLSCIKALSSKWRNRTSTLKNPSTILDLFKPTGSCALNKKGCHFPAIPRTCRVHQKLRAPSPPIFRANFSRLNFDSGAKILGDIIKYDYPGKERRKGESRSPCAEMHRRERGGKGAEEKQKEAAKVGRNDER